jgi:hypothetical protein
MTEGELKKRISDIWDKSRLKVLGVPIMDSSQFNKENFHNIADEFKKDIFDMITPDGDLYELRIKDEAEMIKRLLKWLGDYDLRSA